MSLLLGIRQRKRFHASGEILQITKTNEKVVCVVRGKIFLLEANDESSFFFFYFNVEQRSDFDYWVLRKVCVFEVPLLLGIRKRDERFDF